jgi:DNA segregation ATPase FtsK/SpoIIIE-like protein
MRDRNKWCQDRDIEEYPGKAIYCFIDETADIIVRQGKDALRKFQMLLQMARSANIHMVFCSQCFNRKLIPTEVQCNVTCVVGLKVRATDKILSKLMVGDNSCCNLPRYGKGVVITPDGITTEDIPMYTDEDWNELRKSTLLRRVI